MAALAIVSAFTSSAACGAASRPQPRRSAAAQLAAPRRNALRLAAGARQAAIRGSPRSTSCAATVVAAAIAPTVSETKRRFIEAYPKPLPALYSTVVQEFMVLHHLARYNTAYKYDAVIGLGFCSVFDQVMDGLDATQTSMVFKAYIEALGEDPAKYRADAEKLSEIARSCSAADLKPDANGNELQRALASVASSDNYYYTKWFGIGLFRLLELAGATEPKALEGLVSSLGVKAEAVNRDLLTYKSVLSKMAAARELMAEMMAREKKKQAEREAEKAAKV